MQQKSSQTNPQMIDIIDDLTNVIINLNKFLNVSEKSLIGNKFTTNSKNWIIVGFNGVSNFKVVKVEENTNGNIVFCEFTPISEKNNVRVLEL